MTGVVESPAPTHSVGVRRRGLSPRTIALISLILISIGIVGISCTSEADRPPPTDPRVTTGMVAAGGYQGSAPWHSA